MTTLADYCLPGADPDLVEPFASRLLKVLDHFGGRVMILSGRRSTAQQWVLYNRRQAYLKNPAKWIAEHPGWNIPAEAAYPETSKHERGAAADLKKDDDVTWGAVHYTAHAFGVHFPIPDEDWHAEEIPDWTDPEPEEWDMTDDDMKKLAGYVAAATVEALMKHDVVLSDGKAHKVENIIGYGNNIGNDTVSLLRTISNK